MEKREKRGSNTKQRIWESFYELSRTISFDKITVEKIIAHSGVSKSTFYRYFLDKYDVMNFHSIAVAERIIGQRPCEDWRAFLLFMCEEIEQEKEYYKRAFTTSGQNAHSGFLFEYSNLIVKRCYMLSNNRKEISKEEEYMIAHYCYGCVAIIEDWLNDSNRFSTEAMADLLFELMPERLRDTWVSN